MSIDKAFWTTHYENMDTPWDIGAPSSPLLRFLSTIQDKDAKILIPGAGHAYEAIALHQSGYRQVYVCDWAETCFDYLKSQAPGFPAAHLLMEDFFHLHFRDFDLILEQTFFCAISPDQRSDYVQKCWDLLRPGGQITGLLFATPFEKPGPPFGGHKEEYLDLFSRHFDILEMEIAPDSIAPRRGNELFFRGLRRNL